MSSICLEIKFRYRVELSVECSVGGEVIQNTSFMFVIPGPHISLLANGNDFHLGVLRLGSPTL